MRRAGLYLRISQDRTGEGLGVGRQREDGLRKITERGWTMTQEYLDNDVSASSTRPRPEYQRMLRDLREGVIDAVVVWDIDRLTRRPIEVEEFVELADDHGIALASVGGDVDIATDSGRLFLRIKASVARAEVDAKSRRQKRQRQQTAEAGMQSGGPRPFGYQRGGMALEPTEAALVREAYGAFLAGTSLGAISRLWNELGVKTPRGHAWTYQSVRTVLSNPRNAGLRGVRHLRPGKAGRAGARETWHTIVGDAAWPGIVDRDTWDAVMVVLKDPRRGERHVGNRQRYLLSNIAVCGVCGAPLITGTRRRERLLRCSSLRHVSRKAEPIEQWVVAVLLAKMTDPAVTKALTRHETGPGVDLEALRTRRAALQVRRDEASTDYAELRIERRDRDTVYQRIDAQLRDIDNQLAAVMKTDRTLELVTDDPSAVWDAWPLEIQRKVLAARLRIVVHPGKPGRPGGKRFDRETVEVQWRD